jgi:DnaK suppressor protein
MHASGSREIADRLHSEQARLRNQIAELTDATRPISPDCSLGRLGRMEAIQSQAVQKTELTAAQVRLQLIEAALARLARGEYGWCEACGEPIPPERLAVCPEARRCTACADK